MKKINRMILAFLITVAACGPAMFANAESQAPSVLDWQVSTDHSGENRNDTDDQYITMTVTFDQEILIADPKKAYDELSVKLNDSIVITSEEVFSNGEDWPVHGSLKRGDDGRSVVFDLHYGYAPYASHLTITPVNQITQITGTDGRAVIWKDVSLYVPNGVTFSTLSQTVGDRASSRPASVTVKVNAPSDSTRMMIHVLFLKNGEPAGEKDSYGSNLTTHYHDYLTLTAEGYAALFRGWFNNAYGNDYDILINGDEITVTSKTAADGDVLDLKVFAYPRDREMETDKSGLNRAIEEASSFDPAAYTVASYGLMKDQLRRAEALAASAYYTQEEVNQAEEALSEKIRRLEERNEWNDDSAFPFVDIAPERWSRGAVVYAYNRHLFNGTSDDVFSPEMPMNRAMLVTVLYRMEGAGPAEANMPFTDVAENSYYYDAVKWASSKGIVKGMTEDSFGPEEGLKREQMAAILYRYSEYKGFDTSAAASLDGFQDASRIGEYALIPMKWAVGEKLITGISASELSPLTGATREQVATILMRYCQKHFQN